MKRQFTFIVLSSALLMQPLHSFSFFGWGGGAQQTAASNDSPAGELEGALSTAEDIDGVTADDAPINEVNEDLDGVEALSKEQEVPAWYNNLLLKRLSQLLGLDEQLVEQCIRPLESTYARHRLIELTLKIDALICNQKILEQNDDEAAPVLIASQQQEMQFLHDHLKCLILQFGPGQPKRSGVQDFFRKRLTLSLLVPCLSTLLVGVYYVGSPPGQRTMRRYPQRTLAIIAATLLLSDLLARQEYSLLGDLHSILAWCVRTVAAPIRKLKHRTAASPEQEPGSVELTHDENGIVATAAPEEPEPGSLSEEVISLLHELGIEPEIDQVPPTEEPLEAGDALEQAAPENGETLVADDDFVSNLDWR